jgi:hypothetical protein
MSLNLKQVFGASLLALAVVGGTGTFLTTNLTTSHATIAFDGVTTELPQNTVRHAEVIVTEGRAS